MSAPKSGSYWLYTILEHILEKGGYPKKSFIRQQPVYQHAKDLSLSFEGQAGVDMMDIEEEGCFYRISSFCKEIISDPEEYVRSSGIVWTHSSICSSSFTVFPLFDKRVCIIRDPRDRALSSAEFAFTPYMQQYYPASYSSVSDYLLSEYEQLLEQWIWYTGNFLLHRAELDIHIVFYERLLLDFERELQALLDYLGMTLSLSARQEISQSVAYSTMKHRDPDHLRKGKYGKWVDQLNASQKRLAVDKAEYLLRLLNYPLESGKAGAEFATAWTGVGQEQNGTGRISLPSVPDNMPERALRERLEQMEWPGLFGENDPGFR